MKGIIFFILFVGLIFIAAGYLQANQKCPPPLVVYRYIPRTFEEEQDNPVPLTSIFGSLFAEPDAYMKYRGYAVQVPESLQPQFNQEVKKPLDEKSVNPNFS